MIEKNENIIKEITKMYKKYLLRDPDRDGLFHWITQINENHITLDNLEKIIKDSPEFNLAHQFKQGFTSTSEGFDLWIHPNDEILSRSIVYDKIWEPETTKLIKNIIHEGDVGIDLGANIGYFTMLMANLVGTSGKIFSFEPEPQNFEILQKNIKQNHLKNVVANQSAIGDINGKIKLYLSNTNAGWHKVFPKQFIDYEVSDKNIDVKICSLDKEFIDKKIDFIKMDIEGYEHEALKGMKKTILKNKPIFLIEYNDQNIKKIYKCLNGYKAYIFDVYNNNFKEITLKNLKKHKILIGKQNKKNFLSSRNFYFVPKKKEFLTKCNNLIL